MKKNQPAVSPSQLITLSSDPDFTASQKKRKEAKLPPAPSEETMHRLNEIVKQAPFCFYYHERESDSL